MRRSIRITAAFLYIFCSHFSAAHAQDVAVVKSVDIKPYLEVIEGYRQSCDFGLIEYTLSERESATVLSGIRKGKPDLILAIGQDALGLVKDVKGIPVVFAMVSNPESLLPEDSGKVAGISLNVSARRQLSALLSVMPGVARIGVVYDPQKSALLVREVREAAAEHNVVVVAKAVYSSKEVPGAVKYVMGHVDVFWMVPDSTVVFPEAVESLLLNSFENNVPVLAFAERYVNLGALLSLNIDARDIGRQACEISRGILGGKEAAGTVSQPRKAVLSINWKTSIKMGVNVKENLVRKDGSW